MIERERIDVAVSACPECWTLLCLERPSQAQRFDCPLCMVGLQVRGGFVEALAYGTSNRIHHLT
jgi:hypothetical protein